MYKVIRFAASEPEKYKFAVYAKNRKPICVCVTEQMAEKIAKALNSQPTRQEYIAKMEQSNKFMEEANKVNNEIKEIENQIKRLTAEVVVSEHAILMYLERIEGMDIKAVKEKILTQKTTDLIKKLGNGRYPIGGGKAVVKDNVIVTVYGC